MTWDSPEILVVDDSLTDQVRTSGLIKRFVPCAEVTKAADCLQAEAKLSNGSFDVVVADLVMPGCDGRDLLNFIQKLPKIPAIILATSQGNERVAAECLRRGAVAYLRKQNLAEDLESALKETQATLKENALHDQLMARVMSARCEFEIDSDLSQIQALSNFLLQRLKATTAISPDHLQNIIRSVREALLNAHFHGNMKANDHPLQHSRTDYMEVAEQRSGDPSFSDCQIQLIMDQQKDQLRITVCDGGKGFDVSRVVKNSTPADDRGEGLRQMLASVTDVAWNDSGNAVTLTDRSCELRTASQTTKTSTAGNLPMEPTS